MRKDSERGEYAEFGDWIRGVRLRAGIRSQPQAEQHAGHLHLTLVTQGKLSYIERGMNENPDPEFLRQLAILYKIPYAALASEWFKQRYGVDAVGVSDRQPFKAAQGEGREEQLILGLWNALTRPQRRHMRAIITGLIGRSATQNKPPPSVAAHGQRFHRGDESRRRKKGT